MYIQHLIAPSVVGLHFIWIVAVAILLVLGLMLLCAIGAGVACCVYASWKKKGGESYSSVVLCSHNVHTFIHTYIILLHTDNSIQQSQHAHTYMHTYAHTHHLAWIECQFMSVRVHVHVHVRVSYLSISLMCMCMSISLYSLNKWQSCFLSVPRKPTPRLPTLYVCVQ